MDIFYCNKDERILLEKFLIVFGIEVHDIFYYLNNEPFEIIYNEYQVGFIRYFENNPLYRELIDHIHLILQTNENGELYIIK